MSSTTDGNGETAALIDTLIAAPGSAWAVGILGALAEFSRLDGDLDGDFDGDAASEGPGRTLRSERGALRVERAQGLMPIAYEGLGGRADGWTQTVAFCLPAEAARGPARTVLTELGPDRDAIDAAGDAILFDLGLGSPWIEACVRTGDAALLATLREHAGRSVLDPGSPAMAAIKRASPTRMFRSRAARIEVYQPIGSTARGIPTPAGPHTHVLPGLLKTGRSHAATAPIPEGAVPVLWCYPENPVSGHDGQRRPFDPAAHAAFQSLIDRYAPPGYAAEKRRIAAAVRAGLSPADYAFPESRTGRLAAKVALRQMVHDDPPAGLDAWRERFDTLVDRADPHADAA